jgi:hypothetical protein
MKLTKLLLCFLALGAACLWISNNNTASHANTLTQLGQQHATMTIDNGQSHSILGQPTISASFINTILCDNGSPACGTGQSLYSLGKQYGIDPAWALAFFNHESTYGRFGVASRNLGIGNIRCTSGYVCVNGFRAYQDWSTGYLDWYRLITWYANTLHKSTIETIIPTYAPATENNVNAYIASVVTSVMAWRREA